MNPEPRPAAKDRGGVRATPPRITVRGTSAASVANPNTSRSGRPDTKVRTGMATTVPNISPEETWATAGPSMYILSMPVIRTTSGIPSKISSAGMCEGKASSRTGNATTADPKPVAASTALPISSASPEASSGSRSGTPSPRVRVAAQVVLAFAELEVIGSSPAAGPAAGLAGAIGAAGRAQRQRHRDPGEAPGPSRGVTGRR